MEVVATAAVITAAVITVVVIMAVVMVADISVVAAHHGGHFGGRAHFGGGGAPRRPQHEIRRRAQRDELSALLARCATAALRNPNIRRPGRRWRGDAGWFTVGPERMVAT